MSIVCVKFKSYRGYFEGKIYHYFWPEKYKKVPVGSVLVITAPSGQAYVQVVQYKVDSDHASKYININRVVDGTLRKTEQKESFIKFKEEKKEMKKSITEVTKKSLSETKDVVVKMQTGRTVITALKTTITETEVMPEQLKALVNIPGYSDIAIGLLLNIASQTFTDSKTIQKASEAAQFVGAVEFSDKFTFIQDALESVIKKALSSVEEKLEKIED